MHDRLTKIQYVAFIAGASVGLLMARGFIAGVNKVFPPNPIKN